MKGEGEEGRGGGRERGRKGEGEEGRGGREKGEAHAEDQ